MQQAGDSLGRSVGDGTRNGTRAAVKELLSRGTTVCQAARELGVTAAAVSYHRRMLGLPPSSKYAPRGDWQEIQCYYDGGHSVRECKAHFGFSNRSWNRAVQRGDIVPRPQAVPIDELLVSGRVRNRSHIKRRLMSSGVKMNRCEECGIASWMGEPLNMALHHVNRDDSDNRLENLKLLCANCHSQTSTFARKRSIARASGENPCRAGEHSGAVSARQRSPGPSRKPLPPPLTPAPPRPPRSGR